MIWYLNIFQAIDALENDIKILLSTPRNAIWNVRVHKGHYRVESSKEAVIYRRLVYQVRIYKEFSETAGGNQNGQSGW